MEIMQGDAYSIPIAITFNGEPADGDTFTDVEIDIGTMTKTMSSGEVTWSESESAFLFPLTQAETFRMAALPQKVQVRCKFESGNVIGCDVGTVAIQASVSKVVL